jgi:hypothetical protein
MNLLLSLLPFLLVSTALTNVAVVSVDAQRLGGTEPPSPQGASLDDGQGDDEGTSLYLTVGISDRGFYISGRGGTLAAEPTPGGGGEPAPPLAGPTIGKRAGRYDYAALAAKMVEIKDSFPAEVRVHITADANIPYEVVVKVMDATRATPEGRPLFPEVILADLG